MRKLQPNIKRVAAAAHSVRSVPRGTHTIKSGGVTHTYQNEKELNHVADESAGFVAPGHGWPSLAEIWRIERYLLTRNRVSGRPTADARNEIIKRYKLIYDRRKGRYTADPDSIWNRMTLLYADKITALRIKNYGEAAYRSKYR